MKRIQVRPGRFVSVSDALAEKAATEFASVAYTREQLQAMAAAEPRLVAPMAGPTKRAKR